MTINTLEDLQFRLYFSGKSTGLGSLASSQSVSFRPGSNVEFGDGPFGGSPVSAGMPVGEPIDMAYSLERVGKNRDFSNPMYDAVVQGGNGSGVMGKRSFNFLYYQLNLHSLKSFEFFTAQRYFLSN
jgi:hypothetical protein